MVMKVTCMLLGWTTIIAIPYRELREKLHQNCEVLSSSFDQFSAQTYDTVDTALTYNTVDTASRKVYNRLKISRTLLAPSM